MDGFGVGDMDKKFPFQGMNPKQMQQASIQNGMPQQQDMQQQFSFFPQAVSMMSQAGIPTMQFSAPTGVNSNFRMAQNPANLQQFPPQQQSNLIPNMSGGNQGVNFVPQLSQAAQMTSPPSANSIISFPHLSQIQQSTPTNKNIHDEVINSASGANVDQSAVSQDNNANTPNGLANPQSPAPVSGNNAQVSSPNSGGSANNNNMSTAITPASPGVVRSLAPGGAKATYIDITPYLNMPQKEAARRLGIPTSTLSKRWKEAVRCRKWPYRTICKLDKEIMALLQNIPQDYNTRTNQLPEEIETTLGYLLRKRQEELQPVIIRV
jgi:hypothetical protein